jgi:hypothetical protein
MGDALRARAAVLATHRVRLTRRARWRSPARAFRTRRAAAAHQLHGHPSPLVFSIQELDRPLGEARGKTSAQLRVAGCTIGDAHPVLEACARPTPRLGTVDARRAHALQIARVKRAAAAAVGALRLPRATLDAPRLLAFVETGILAARGDERCARRSAGAGRIDRFSLALPRAAAPSADRGGDGEEPEGARRSAQRPSKTAGRRPGHSRASTRKSWRHAPQSVQCPSLARMSRASRPAAANCRGRPNHPNNPTGLGFFAGFFRGNLRRDRL